MGLSKRLAAIAKEVPDGAYLADVCCDHAWIPITLLSRNHIRRAVACDLREKPLQYAAQYATEWHIPAEKIEFRQGDGLSPLLPGETDVLILSGIGGILMVQILSACPRVVCSMEKLILSPNRAPWEVRKWVRSMGFFIEAEKVVQESTHFYEIIVVDPQKEACYSDTELYFGPTLLQNSDDVTSDYYDMRRKKDMTLLARWQEVSQKSEDICERAEKLAALWTEWEEIRCRFV